MKIYTLRLQTAAFNKVKFFSGLELSQVCNCMFKTALLHITRFVSGNRRSERLQLLKHQRLLLRSGLEATAEVMDAVLFEDRVGSQLPIKLWIKLKKVDGSFLFTHTKTLVPISKIPSKGQLLQIKYIPGDIDSIVIL